MAKSERSRGKARGSLPSLPQPSSRDQGRSDSRYTGVGTTAGTRGVSWISAAMVRRSREDAKEEEAEEEEEEE